MFSSIGDFIESFVVDALVDCGIIMYWQVLYVPNYYFFLSFLCGVRKSGLIVCVFGGGALLLAFVSWFCVTLPPFRSWSCATRHTDLSRLRSQRYKPTMDRPCLFESCLSSIASISSVHRQSTLFVCCQQKATTCPPTALMAAAPTTHHIMSTSTAL